MVQITLFYIKCQILDSEWSDRSIGFTMMNDVIYLFFLLTLFDTLNLV